MNRFVVVLAVGASMGGCSLVVETSGLAGTEPDAAPDAEGGIAAIADASPDARAPATTTRVSCDEPSVCGDRAGCCVVYGPSGDFCVDEAAKCVFGSSPTVFITCDDADDCAALGFPDTVCCGEVDDRPKGIFTSAPTCRPSAQCNGRNAVQLCDAIGKVCPAGTTCKMGNYASDIWACD